MRIILRLLLGGVLLTAGIAKSFVVPEFAGAVREILNIPQDLAGVAAIGAIVIESLVGAGLILSRHVRWFALAACALFGLFLWVLGAILVEGREVPCYCFGLLPLRLSNQAEVLLDVLFLNAACMLVLTSGRAPMTGRSRTVSVLAAGGMLFSQVILMRAVFAGGIEREKSEMPVLVRFAETEAQGFTKNDPRSRLLLVVDLHDFTCSPCFEDFLAFCDIVRKTAAPLTDGRVVLLIRHRGGRGEPSPGVLKAWARETNVSFAVAVVPESVAAAAGVGRSAGILVSREGHEIVRHEFPMRQKGRDELIQLLQSD
jgi:uncharacterized membrane protein YphA (DoxX/SURF4 family)